jgi:hypothetical protein
VGIHFAKVDLTKHPELAESEMGTSDVSRVGTTVMLYQLGIAVGAAKNEAAADEPVDADMIATYLEEELGGVKQPPSFQEINTIDELARMTNEVGDYIPVVFGFFDAEKPDWHAKVPAC